MRYRKGYAHPIWKYHLNATKLIPSPGVKETRLVGRGICNEYGLGGSKHIKVNPTWRTFILQCFLGHPCYVWTPVHGSSVIDAIRPTLEPRIWLPSLMFSYNLPTYIPPPTSTLLANQSIQIFSGNPLSCSVSPGLMRRDNMIFATINRVLDALHCVRSSCCRLREWNLLQNVNGHGCEYVIWP